MYELIEITENSYYVQCPAKIGIVKTGPDRVCLIDSGNDRTAGKKVKNILEAKGWKPDAIYNTHSHADHIGGNQFLQNLYGCRIYAPGIERDFTEHTILEPSYVWGANPPGELRHKFMLAQGSRAQNLTAECLPEGMKVIPLPGHSWDMVGFRTPDNVVYLGDCLSSPQTLEKYGICFLTDVEAYLKTLEKVMTLEAAMFVPAHAQPSGDIRELARMNIDKVFEISGEILKICSIPVSFETLLAKLFERYNLTMNFEQYALVGSTVRCYLTWLSGQGRITPEFQNNIMLWSTEG